MPVRVDGALDGAAALAGVPAAVGGSSVRLADIAIITHGYTDQPASSIRHNGAPAVVIAVSAQKGTDGQAFGNSLRAETARIRAGLPLGLELQQIADQPAVIGEAVGKFLFEFAAALGGVLAVSFLVMDLLGIELQRISLGALILSLGCWWMMPSWGHHTICTKLQFCTNSVVTPVTEHEVAGSGVHAVMIGRECLRVVCDPRNSWRN